MKGEFGFAPSNYIELTGAAAAPEPEPALASPPLPSRPRVAFAEPEPEQDEPPTPSSVGTPIQSPAAALAGIIAKKSTAAATAPRPAIASPPLPPRVQYTPEESEDEQPKPSLPQRQASESRSLPTQYATARSPDPEGVRESPGIPDGQLSPRGGFHLYNIHEMVSAMGRSRKVPMTLGINVAKGVIMISPEKSRDGQEQEWTAEKLTHYSIEGKHVFIELVRPSKSVDFHAGAKDTAQEIVTALGELAGAVRAEGLREVIAASGGSVQKKGKMLYEFMAQGDDEVTVAEGDEVIILDEGEEWWQVRRLKNGKEGVVPASYIEVFPASALASPTSPFPSTKSIVEQNRREEERITREIARKQKEERAKSEVGPGFQLPERGSSLSKGDDSVSRNSSKREQRDRQEKAGSRPSKYIWRSYIGHY